MDIFEIQPMLDSSPEGCGAEPSMRRIIFEYYALHFEPTAAAHLTEEYIATLMREAN